MKTDAFGSRSKCIVPQCILPKNAAGVVGILLSYTSRFAPGILFTNFPYYNSRFARGKMCFAGSQLRLHFPQV